MAVPISENPFAVLTLVAAPALLTNATSVLALSTINRILRSGDRMRALAGQLESGGNSREKHAFLLAQVERVERQSVLLLRALHAVYVALGLLMGFTGVGGLVWGSMNLLWATRISMQNIAEEAALIRRREQGQLPTEVATPPGG